MRICKKENYNLVLALRQNVFEVDINGVKKAVSGPDYWEYVPHPALIKGKQAISAGIIISEYVDDRLVSITIANKSGHYKPDFENDYLRSLNYIENAVADVYPNVTIDLKDYKEIL